MPSLGLSLALPRIAGSSYDPDALSYFGTAAVTDAIGRTQINNFVAGIKSLGLWNNMVAWPLRSTQNAGTGVTAYSLGGLGVYGGTLTGPIGLPTWGTGGVSFDGIEDFISTALTSGFSELSVFGISKKDATSVLMEEIAKDDESTNRDWILFAELSGAVKSRFYNPSDTTITGSAVTTDFRVACMRGSATVNKLRVNNGSDFTGTTGTLNQGSAPVALGARSNGTARFFKGIMAGAIIFNKALTDSETSAVYALYQTSLGEGLGLPDADASAYIARAGVTDTTGQQQINDFVVGVKNLGLYNNMVAWPLRSTQNAGTGVTACSLGGLGVYDATLIGAGGLPTWGTTGITFDGTDDYIDTAFTTALSEYSVFSTTQATASGARRYECIKDDSASNRQFGFYQETTGDTRFYQKNSGASPAVTVGPAFTSAYKMHIHRGGTGINKLRRNNGADVSGPTGTIVLATVPFRMGATGTVSPTNYFLGTMSGTILFNKALTDSETSSMYTLYRSTIGTGLGLPDPDATFYRDFQFNKTLNHGTGPDISLTRASAATYFNSAGVLTSAAINEPRFDHDPVTLESKGLLVEVARQNLLLRSSEFSDAAWNKTNDPVTVTADQIAAPDGTTSADLIAATTDNDRHVALQTVSGATAVAYTISVFVKQGTQRYIIFGDAGDAVWRLLTFDFNTLSISGTTNLTSSSVTSVGNGWYRLTATATRTNTTTYQIFLGFSNVAANSTPLTYVASASDNFYAWGAQLEVGAFASSYITTAGNSAGRSSDLPIVEPISSFYNQAEGTIFVQQSQVAISQPTSFRALEISNSGATFRKPLLLVNTNNTITLSTLGGTAEAVSNSSNTVSANTVYKIACAYASNNFRGALNGALASSDTTVDVATPIADRMTIGHSTSIPSFQVSCHIQKVEYYPTRLSDARMQSLTTL